MIIRKAVEKDYESICLLYKQVDQLHADKLPHIFQAMPENPLQREYFLGLIHTYNSIIFIAEEKEQVIGFINVLVRVSSDIPVLVPRCYGIIENISVDQEYRGRGVGRALMSKAHEWALEMGAGEIELNVYEFNRTAQIFYENLGYKTQSRRMILKIGE
jgi:ribosomal protein S18 acetylase RimI-like enzyme